MSVKDASTYLKLTKTDVYLCFSVKTFIPMTCTFNSIIRFSCIVNAHDIWSRVHRSGIIHVNFGTLLVEIINISSTFNHYVLPFKHDFASVKTIM